MKLIKDIDNIDKKDYPLCQKIINRLKMGERVFGNPSEGLRETLKIKEKELVNLEESKGHLDVLSNTGDLLADIAKLKAGIKGEETLAEFLERVIRWDDKLQDIIFFASLSDPNYNSGGDDYISDSDFIAVYGNNLLIIDAKNIITNPEIPLYLSNNILIAAGGKEILELHPATYIWQNILSNTSFTSIDGCVVIVNNRGATIWKNEEWYTSNVKPIHQSELVDFLHDWIKNRVPETNLSLLLALAKTQIKPENKEAERIRSQMRRFGV